MSALGEVRARAWGSVSRWDRVTWAVLAITLVALVTRTAELGVRAIHHDESLHLFYAWQLSEGAGYEHHPLMHGPLQFHLMAAFFWLFGDSEFVGRLPHALAGTALVATPLLFRRWLNKPAVVLTAGFLLVSPSILYYSRFARNEPFVALFTVVMVWAMLSYRRDGRLRWLVAYTLAFALQFAAKETGYLIVAMLLLYQNAWVAHDLFWGPRRERLAGASRLEQVRGAVLLTPVAWVIALAWPLLRRWRGRYGWYRRPRSADLLVVTATLVLPLLAAAAEIPLLLAGVELDAGRKQWVATLAVPATIGLAVIFGWLWQPRWWAWLALAWVAVLVPLYTTLGTNPGGVDGIVWSSLDYWIDQQDVRRGTQPWFYYLWMLPLYESLVLIPAIVGGAWLVARRRDWLAALLLFWFAVMLAALTYAGEKMPWLTVHLVLPLVFLAGHAIGSAVPPAVSAFRSGRGGVWRWSGGAASVAVLVLLAALTVRVDWGLNHGHPDTPVEPMIYVQTSPQVPVLAVELRALVAAGQAERIVIHTDQSLTWPWAWYLRGMPLAYVDRVHLNQETLQPTDVLLTMTGHVSSGSPLARQYPPPLPYAHRWWFPEAGYRAMTPGSLWSGLTRDALLGEWSRFLLERADPQTIGSLRAEVYLPRTIPLAEVERIASALEAALGRAGRAE